MDNSNAPVTFTYDCSIDLLQKAMDWESVNPCINLTYDTPSQCEEPQPIIVERKKPVGP